MRSTPCEEGKGPEDLSAGADGGALARWQSSGRRPLPARAGAARARGLALAPGGLLLLGLPGRLCGHGCLG